MDPFVKGMALVRLISAVTELTGAYLMIRMNRLDAAVRVNALLGLIGPLVLLAATTIGVVGLADRLSPPKLFLILAGVGLILLGTR